MSMSMEYYVENLVTVTYLEESKSFGTFHDGISEERFDEVSVELDLLLCKFDCGEGGRILSNFYTKEVYSEDHYNKFIDLLLSMGYSICQ